MPLDSDDVREILRLIDESEVDEIRVETDELSLHVLRGTPPTVEPAPPTAEEPPPDGELHTITAPMLGVFYRAEAPGAAPFVAVGARVDRDTTVCLIEVMKMMNPIPAGVAGTVVDVCVENSKPVEYGAPLFLVRGDGA